MDQEFAISTFRHIVAIVALTAGWCAVSPADEPDAQKRAADAARSLRQFTDYVNARYRDDVEKNGLPPPPNENLAHIRPLFPALRETAVPGAQTLFVRDSGVIRQAYESGGKLFFSLDRSPSLGIHFLSFYDLDRTITPITLPPGDFGDIFFTEMTPSVGIVKAFSRTNPTKEFFWSIHDGRIAVAGGPGQNLLPQWTNAERCVANAKSERATDAQASVAAASLARSSAGIAFQPGIETGCRRLGPTTLLWLTAHTDDSDGVTYVAGGSRLRPLFRGHPFIETKSFLVFSDSDPISDVFSYLFVHLRDARPGEPQISTATFRDR